MHPKAAVRSGTDIAWAVRKTAPDLVEVLNRMIDNHNLNGGRQTASDLAAIMEGEAASEAARRGIAPPAAAAQ